MDSEPEKVFALSSKLRPGQRVNVRLIAHQIANVPSPSGRGVAANHDAICAHQYRSAAAARMVKHRAVDAETVKIVTWRMFESTTHDVTAMPRIFQSPKQGTENHHRHAQNRCADHAVAGQTRRPESSP